MAPESTELQDHRADRSRDTLGPTLDVVERAITSQINDWLANADRIEKALDDISDIRRWPRFCMLLSVAVSSTDVQARIAATESIASMLKSAMADEAADAVMRDLGMAP